MDRKRSVSGGCGPPCSLPEATPSGVQSRRVHLDAQGARTRFSRDPCQPFSQLLGGECVLGRVDDVAEFLTATPTLYLSLDDRSPTLDGPEKVHGQAVGALERRLRHYARPALLAIDEIGYLAYDAHAADLLFQIVSRRYEHRSLLMTTNLAFKHWDTIFPNASCAVALIDRLTHHAEIVVIEGDGYRKREAELSQKQRRTKTRKRR